MFRSFKPQVERGVRGIVYAVHAMGPPRKPAIIGMLPSNVAILFDDLHAWEWLIGGRISDKTGGN